MHADLTFDERWEERIVGLRESGQSKNEPLSLQVARAFSIARHRGNLASDARCVYRRITETTVRTAMAANDRSVLPEPVRELLEKVETNECLDLDHWRRTLRLEGATVFRHGYAPWSPGDGWGRAFSASPLDSSQGLYGEYYPDADWNLGLQWPGIPLAEALDLDVLSALEEIVSLDEEYEGVPVEVVFAITQSAISPLHHRPQRFFRNEAFMKSLKRFGHSAWRCAEPARLTEELVRNVSPASVVDCRVLVSELRPIVRQSACGPLAYEADDLDCAHPAILLCDTPAPELAEQLPCIAGVITKRANPSSHLAILLARDGIPFFQCRNIESVRDSLPAGTTATLDGVNGVLYEGRGEVAAPPVSEQMFRSLMSSQAKNPVKVYANADTRENAVLARRMGAVGIGLLRTEHLHTQEPWKTIVANLLRGEMPEAETMRRLHDYQRMQLSGVFEVMADWPVTVRLLDAPLHEFDAHANESNPMMGYRGVRALLGVPALLELQCRAVAEAWHEAGNVARPKLMVPLVALSEEVALILRMIQANPEWGCADLEVGVMVETPRACFKTDHFVREGARFLSFGTNDLTQFTWGLSRDDAAARTLPQYRSAGVASANPFERLDTRGVGLLICEAIQRARAVAPDLPVSICGEQAADIAAAGFLRRVGVTALSVAPHLVPQTIAAAAQAQESLR